MKKNLILLILLVLVLSISYYLYKNKKDVVCNTNVEQKKIEIDNNISKYSTTSKDIFGRSTEGGQQTNYTFDGKNKLIEQIFFGETGKSEIKYYLDSDKVFYIGKINTEYALPIYEDTSGKVKNVDMKEFYLDNNENLCSWYLNQNLQINDQDTKDLVKDFILGL
jgi:uncharacterized protein YxeA